MSKNTNLHDAKRAKKDEFYTQWVDIENEMNAYLDYNPDVFKDKTILLPCDDPEWSNFTKYFALRFQDFGIKKLISTSYAPRSNMEGLFYNPQPSLFDDIKYDETKDYERGKIFVLDGADVNGDGRVNIEDFEWEYLQGDGDFRSDEVTALRDEVDMVITNPPFSLFREFVEWLEEGNVQYSVISNQNAVTYKEIFPLIKDDRMWYGKGFPSAVGFFKSPYEDTAVATDKKEGFIRVSGVIWLTNIEHGRRHEHLPLMTMEDNKRFNNRIMKNPNSYKTYDNYDAIEVPVTAGIPSDYEGVMGVPISFLDKYSPEQFEILGSFNAGAHGEEVGSTYTPTIIGGKEKLWNGPVVDKQPLYKRILIKHKTQPEDD